MEASALRADARRVMVSLMRDVLSIVKVRTSESGYAVSSEILSDLRALCDTYSIPVHATRPTEPPDA